MARRLVWVSNRVFLPRGSSAAGGLAIGVLAALKHVSLNRRFARVLVPLLRPDDLIWIHDYHLIPLGSQLRALGVKAPIGFFLHVPFPHIDVLRVDGFEVERRRHVLRKVRPIEARALLRFDDFANERRHSLDQLNRCLIDETR